jgi:DNA replication protein DnaC
MSKSASNPNSGSTSNKPQLAEGQLEPLFRRLNLAHTRRIYQDVADRAEKENWSYRDFLALLLAEEVAHRKQTRLQRCTRQAHFPFFKTIDEFDFSLQTTLRQSLLGSYLGPDFVTEGRSLILYGKAGRGKTHLAVAIGYRAIQNGFETLCTTAAKLVEDLSNASKKGCLQESLLTYTHPHVLLVDEVGYLTYGPDAANVLFHVVNDRHLRKRPMIFTTNKPLSEWGRVLHDDDLAAAILDRILERGRLIHLDGTSGRTRHLNLEGVLPGAAERARISGIRVPEFPEPTQGIQSRIRVFLPPKASAFTAIVQIAAKASVDESLQAPESVAGIGVAIVVHPSPHRLIHLFDKLRGPDWGPPLGEAFDPSSDVALGGFAGVDVDAQFATVG